jgi:hypothetical protein
MGRDSSSTASQPNFSLLLSVLLDSRFGSHLFLIPEKIPPSFHALTNCKFHNPFVLLFIQIARGCTPFKKEITNTTMQEPAATLHSHPSTVITNNGSDRCQYRYSNGKLTALFFTLESFKMQIRECRIFGSEIGSRRGKILSP